ncbi:MAG: chromosome segregation protein SMC [Gammaproteobacteria bacterium]|nr:chromosome segregation protein SMC [Gammaproteobacteria bacterium]
MRLRKVKMSGFKSFVDSTDFLFPSDMVGIVGPNGCGKSNIVDAIRWVMGASSKNIRGDTLEDVIFKGSSNRKPVGQASVELVFDNAQGKAGGQYASYSEIAIRRQVTRDGQSKYFLNGTHCRRRDISDIFLGTGLGPRSYAIIEQGTISRLIDAKPEEMRSHLEEAAGISKYKERRRETENRIRHTRENLDRLNDLIEEVAKQIAKLKRQASAAEKYKQLKAEERRSNAELLLLRMQSMHTELDEQHKSVEHGETKLEETIANLRALEAELEQLRQEHGSANELMNKVQGEFYQVGADISRLEQSIQHATETKQRHETDLEKTKSNLEALVEELAKQDDAQQEFKQQMQIMQTELESLSEQYQEVGEAVSSAETAELLWREAWEELMQEANEPSHQVQAHSQRIEFLDQEINRLQDRQQKYQSEHTELLQSEHEYDLESIQKRLETRSEAVNDCKHMLDQSIENITQSREKIEELVMQLDDHKAEHQQINSELATLQAIQDAALKGEQQQLQQWISDKKLDQAPRLADQVEVEAGWERAVETVLDGYLEAICAPDLDKIATQLGELQEGHVMFFESKSAQDIQASKNTLASKIKSNLGIKAELQKILVADNLNQALAIRKQLQDGESVITSDGLWLSISWVRYSNAADASEGVLSRKADIADLTDQLDKVDETIAVISQQHQAALELLSDQEQQREDAQQAHNLAFQQHAEIQSELSRRQAAIEHWQARDTQLRSSIEEIAAQLSDYTSQKQAATESHQVAQVNLNALQVRKDQLLGRKEVVVFEFNERKEQASELQERRHSLQLEIEALRTRSATSKSIFSRLQMEQSEGNLRLEHLAEAITESDRPIKEFSETLKEKLESRLQVEQRLSESRSTLEKVEATIRDKDEQRISVDNKIGEQREQLNQQRMKWQELKVRAQTIKEQLDQFDWSEEELANELPEDASLSHWEKLVAQIEEKIKRLGSINLAAIDEYKEQSERKEYLDSQNEDLTKALETLETAIRKIDKETKERFKDTFDRVNSHIQRMYPRLFPGGKAYLEMTGDDLLTAGVTIMARPPGKRVSSIQLLSGGEKALTAVALVLAIFELNPAPFCLLDEVDAPLDDANVGRFCELLKDMSKHVQFVFITHNKSTMGYADHMLGVTMNEPGVSRLVSVDIEEAVKLATA